MLKNIIIFFIANIGLMSCASNTIARVAKQDVTTESVVILSHQTPCFGMYQRLCLQTGEQGAFYNEIEGFEAQWGYTYQLTLNVTDIANPPADASSLHYSLIDIVSAAEDEIGMHYEYERVNLFPETFSKAQMPFTFLGQPFVCSAQVDCDTLVQLTGRGVAVYLLFEYLGEGTISLIQWQVL